MPGSTHLGVEAVGITEVARALLHEAIALNPDLLPAHLSLATAYHQMGDERKARAEIAEVRRIAPHFSIDKWAERLLIKGDAKEATLAAWRALEAD